MDISPSDAIILFEYGFVKISATIGITWALMLFMTLGSWLVTRKLSTGVEISRWQNLLEIIVVFVKKQIEDVGLSEPRKYLGFLGTLFLFIVVSNLFAVIPGYYPPTGSPLTTSALAICVFVAVPLYGIGEKGVGGYFKRYVQPTPFLLPFNIIGDLSRTLALAVRLFGNIMSGTMICGILLTVLPLFAPVIMQALGLLTGMVQAYIFVILATVYIAAATREKKGAAPPPELVAGSGNEEEQDTRKEQSNEQGENNGN